MANGTRMLWEPFRLVDAGDIDINYLAMGNPVASPARIVSILNLCNETLYVSTDGIEDMIVAPASVGRVWDICAARTGGNLNGAYEAINTTFYVRSPSGAATGDGVYLELQYIFGD